MELHSDQRRRREKGTSWSSASRAWSKTRTPVRETARNRVAPLQTPAAASVAARRRTATGARAAPKRGSEDASSRNRASGRAPSAKRTSSSGVSTPGDEGPTPGNLLDGLGKFIEAFQKM